MAVRIRLARGGAKKRPIYRIVAADSRSPRDGRFIEKLGVYNPILANDGVRLTLNEERIKYWLGTGAQPSERVARLLGEAGIIAMPPTPNRPNKSAPKAKAVERAKQAAEAAAAAAAPAEEAPAEQAAAEEAAEAPAEDAAAEEAPAEAATAEQAPAEEAAVEEASADADEKTSDDEDKAKS